MLEAVALIFEIIETLVVSRPRELPPQTLAERYVNLSVHTAPIKQTLLSYHSSNVQIIVDFFGQGIQETDTP